MKQFFIIRHAKSSWEDFNLKDFDRPLNKRGLHDAPKMATLLEEMSKFNIDLIYSSPANRAQTTARYFHDAFKVKSPIDLNLEIYHADVEDLIYLINNTEDSLNVIALFGHNPGFTYLVNHFALKDIDNLPTCGIAHFETSADRWQNVNTDNTKLVKLLVPKKTIY